MDWITRYDYSEMIEKYFNETEEKDIHASDYVYIVRGMPEIVYDKFTEEPVIYTPIINYCLYLNDVPSNEEYERLKSFQLINELIDINTFD